MRMGGTVPVPARPQRMLVGGGSILGGEDPFQQSLRSLPPLLGLRPATKGVSSFGILADLEVKSASEDGRGRTVTGPILAKNQKTSKKEVLSFW